MSEKECKWYHDGICGDTVCVECSDIPNCVQKQLAKLKAENEELKTQAISLSVQFKRAEMFRIENEALKEENDKLQICNDAQQRTIKVMDADLATKEKIIDGLELQIVCKDTKLISLEDEVSSLEAELDYNGGAESE